MKVRNSSEVKMFDMSTEISYLNYGSWVENYSTVLYNGTLHAVHVHCMLHPLNVLDFITLVVPDQEWKL